MEKRYKNTFIQKGGCGRRLVKLNLKEREKAEKAEKGDSWSRPDSDNKRIPFDVLKNNYSDLFWDR